MNLGVLLGISPQHLILRAQEWDLTKEIPEIGDWVYNAQKILVGKIADIFGPVKKPFISIQIIKKNTITLIDFQAQKGHFFYTLPEKKKSIRSNNPKKFQKMAPRPSKTSKDSLHFRKSPSS